MACNTGMSHCKSTDIRERMYDPWILAVITNLLIASWVLFKTFYETAYGMVHFQGLWQYLSTFKALTK